MGRVTGIQEVNIADLKPYERNAKQHGSEQVKKLCDSIREFGFISPCLIDSDLNVIAGHGRIMAAREMGMEKVPCLFVEGLTETQRKAYILADNRLTELGEWDMDIVNAELMDLDLADFDVSLTGFDFELPEEQDEIEEDDVPELEDETTVQRGYIYQLGDHRLMCGDSTSREDVAALMGGQRADMVFTDPPYGYEYESNFQDTFKMLKNDDKILDFVGASYEVMQENCPVYSFCGWQTLRKWLEYFDDTRLSMKNIIVWEKNNWSMGDLKGAYAGQYEIIIYLNKGRVELKGARDTDIWKFDREPPKEHPTMKPVELIVYALRKSSEVGGVILDLFGGSGSTLIACEQTGRKCCMMELDPHYVDVIIKRWENLTGLKAVLLNG